MLSLLIGLGVGILALTISGILLLWPHIREVLKKHVLPFCRKIFPSNVATSLTKLTQWLDQKVSFTRKSVKALWKNFREVFIGRKTTYKQTGYEEYTSIGENYIKNKNGSVTKQTIEEDIDFADIPEEMRNEFYNGKNEVATDEMDNTKKKVKHEVQEQFNSSKEELELILN